MRRLQLLACMAALTAFLWAPTARAQEEGEAAPAAEETTAESAGAAEEESSGRAPFPRISDDEETIYAVQRKAYLVKDKWEITPMAGLAFNDRFVQTFTFAGQRDLPPGRELRHRAVRRRHAAH